jgi:hypothetical protein
MVTAAGAVEDDAMSMLQGGRRETETAPGKTENSVEKNRDRSPPYRWKTEVLGFVEELSRLLWG